MARRSSPLFSAWLTLTCCLSEHDHSPKGANVEETIYNEDEVSKLEKATFRGPSLRTLTQASTLHANHRHCNMEPPTKGYDLGMLGVLIHVMGDAVNNIGVIISGLVIWLTKGYSRYYADSAVSMAISLIILATSTPLG